MYNHDRSEEDNDQDFAHNANHLLLVSNQPKTIEDPAKAQILSKVSSALSSGHIPDEQPGLTIGDVCDLTGFKEGFVRDRLGELVEEGALGCEQGKGRRPSYYMFLEELEQLNALKRQDREVEYSDSKLLSHSKNEELKASDLMLIKVKKRKQELAQIIKQTSILLADCEATERFLLQMGQELREESAKEHEDYL